MKKRALILTVIATGSLMANISPAYADMSKDQNNFYSNILMQIKNGVFGIENTVNNIAKMLLETPKNIGNDITAWASVNKLSQTQSMLTKAYNNSLDASFKGKNTVSETVNTAYNMNTKPVGIYSPLSAYSLLGLTQTSANNKIYYTKTYNNAQAQAAGGYVKFLAGAALPSPSATGDSIKAKQEENLIRTMQAVQSLDAYNLSRLYASRMPIASSSALKLNGIGTPAGKISKEGLLKYLMQSKVNNPAWYTQMSTASPFTAVRQGTFLLAAAVSELYRIEQNQEQMILTQTANNTATLAMAKTMMMQMQQANQSIEKAKNAG